jgi:hypothetical protein
MITIKEVENGYILKWEFSDSDETHVFEGDNKETFIKLAEKLWDILGDGYNRFGIENINITFDKKGYKAE